MKRITLFIIIATVTFACTKEKSVTISGKITNPIDENIIVHINYLDQSDTVTLAEDGTFLAKIDVTDEYLGTLKNGSFVFPVYLVPGVSINIVLDFDDPKDKNSTSTKITGEGSEPTAFMYKLKNMGFKCGIKELLKMPVDSFTIIMNEGMERSEDAIQKFQTESSPSAKFIETIRLISKIGFAQYYSLFIRYHHRYARQDTLPIPDSFQAFVDEIPVNDSVKINEIPEYKSWLTSYWNKKIKETLSADTTINYRMVAYTEKNIDEIIALNTPTIIKDELGYRLLIYGYPNKPDSIQKVYKNRYKEILKKQKYIDAFENVLANIVKTKPGSIAPSFSYPDINGNMVSSESLKGKVIYIDVWATWCGPCKSEIPHLKKMEEELSDEEIAFVSISIDDDKKAWENMVKEKELTGYQLYAKEAWKSAIIKKYAIGGIPRFIIVDKNGNIVDSNATRPSTPSTKKKLLELAKK